jgi:hypothetical protein
MNPILIGMMVVVIGVLLAVIAQLEFDLWLSRRDVRILRQVPMVAPDRAPQGDGCSAVIVVVGLVALGLYIVSRAV